ADDLLALQLHGVLRVPLRVALEGDPADVLRVDHLGADAGPQRDGGEPEGSLDRGSAPVRRSDPDLLKLRGRDLDGDRALRIGWPLGRGLAGTGESQVDRDEAEDQGEQRERAAGHGGFLWTRARASVSIASPEVHPRGPELWLPPDHFRRTIRS